MSNKEHDVTRRQFLNYTLMGVGGFMAAGLLTPMVRFAIDPLLREEKGGKMVDVMAVKDITTEPQRKTFSIDKVDGWHKFKEQKIAYIFKKDNGEIMALSPVCTHLGCTVSWNDDPAHPNQFHCPCHGGRYTKDGINIPGTPPPAPLSVYEMKVKDGRLYLGAEKPRGGA
ncbi:ubiquinol-cytochrome c reductase iron-sulfur subunit [Tuberibacillus calidus]|jgi:menaquinol-cytochrome c reductase iron-sulfur subunit|uniref:ubiquinol-cytochrome c reductase iron-sulfur subunit n=1 Tax=Tuberibacillus calidus TaxID=340097 RepID=UPI000405BB28|nr:ubiquinol-cytochrome c reductase iron-sulfur subunit [Tuberibacillus calidus]